MSKYCVLLNVFVKITKNLKFPKNNINAIKYLQSSAGRSRDSLLFTLPSVLTSFSANLESNTM